ncbi:hypothetical protein JHK87_031664 [Glycine soja]|nr:hypothetical protein JHK87_031664 [Glycine soja]
MKKMMLEIRKSLPTVQKKACILRKLILGCRKVSFPKLLEEVSDYISVLKMQVQAMKALVDVLATSASSPAPIVVVGILQYPDTSYGVPCNCWQDYIWTSKGS